jgi:hypothetical protein
MLSPFWLKFTYGYSTSLPIVIASARPVSIMANNYKCLFEMEEFENQDVVNIGEIDVKKGDIIVSQSVNENGESTGPILSYVQAVNGDGSWVACHLAALTEAGLGMLSSGEPIYLASSKSELDEAGGFPALAGIRRVTPAGDVLSYQTVPWIVRGKRRLLEDKLDSLRSALTQPGTAQVIWFGGMVLFFCFCELSFDVLC